MDQLDTLKSQERSVLRNTQVVEQMYTLLAQYDVKAPSEDMVQLDDLRTIQVQRGRGARLRIDSTSFRHDTYAHVVDPPGEP